MKRFFALIILFSFSAQANIQVALNKMADSYAKISEADLVENNYWMAFYSNSENLKALLDESPNCKQISKFKTTSVKKTLATIHNVALEGINAGYSDDVELAKELEKELIQSTDILKKSLNKSKIKVCNIEETPSYSDGHHVSVFLVNNHIQFAVEVGYPD